MVRRSSAWKQKSVNHSSSRTVKEIRTLSLKDDKIIDRLLTKLLRKTWYVTQLLTDTWMASHIYGKEVQKGTLKKIKQAATELTEMCEELP